MKERNGNKSATFSLGPATIEKINQLAKLWDLSKSGVIRMTISETLNRYLANRK
jgi:predicted transcriptional regulator